LNLSSRNQNGTYKALPHDSMAATSNRNTTNSTNAQNNLINQPNLVKLPEGYLKNFILNTVLNKQNIRFI
jgi:hypothetical protein